MRYKLKLKSKIKPNSNSNSLIGLLLLLYIGVVVLANMMIPEKSFSETENRVLEGRPIFSLKHILSGQFTSNYERYASDQIALRNLWVGIKTDVDRTWGKRESNGVFLSKDGYLMERYSSPTDTELTERGKVFQALDQATPNLHKVVMLVPTAAAVFPDKLPAYAPVGDQLMDLQRISELMPSNIQFADVYSALYSRRNESVFYKTDHHWTTTGAYYAYHELAKNLKITPQDESAFRIHMAADDFYGSLYSKSGFRHLEADQIQLYLPLQEKPMKVSYEEEGRVTDSLYEESNLNEKDKYAVFLDGNHALIRIITDGSPNKRLLIVKDSYANSLIPFLTQHYGEIDVVDLRYYNHSLLKLIQERDFQDMLILYNIKTFFEDPSILNLMEETP